MYQRIAAIVAMATIGLAVLTAQVSAKTVLKSEATAAGDPTYTLLVLTNNYLRNAGSDIEIQVSAGVPVPRSMLSGAIGDLDIYPITWIATKWMRDREKIFKSVENAPELVKDVRSVLSYQGGAYHLVVFDNSAIKSLSDIREKRVFLGPKASTASVMADLIIRSSTGYVAGKDYEPVSLDWGGGAQAMQDGQLDLFVRPTTVGSEIISQIASRAPIRLLSMPDKAFENAEVSTLLKLPGRTVDEIAVGTYRNQKNTEGVKVFGYWQGIGARKDLDPDHVYEITKVFWENLENTHTNAAYMRATTRETAFNHMAAPLHAGAYRYYKEAGFDIPEELIPAEAK